MNADGGFTRGWVERFAASVAATEGELTALDQRAGDGDFGVNMLEGLAATTGILAEMPAERTQAAAEPLEVMAQVFLDQVGGTSGPLFGLLFQEMAEAVRSAGPELTTASLATGTEAGLAAIRRVGEAAPGDKTLVDALSPAVEALQEREPALPPAESLRAAAAQAWRGVHNTSLLRARMGRASYLGDRVSGVPDPGAVGVAVLFSSAEESLTSLTPFLGPDGTAPA